MTKKVRWRRLIRCGLCFAVTVGLMNYFIPSLDQAVQTSHRQIDLRKYQSNFPILSPSIEPRVTDFEDLFVLVIVSTSPNDEMKRRDTIRRTWGNCDKTNNNNKWKVVFMMGKSLSSDRNEKLMAEHKRYGDLLIADYIDKYRNITTKLLMSFKWATRIRCNYILKTDSDVYVDIPELMKWLLNRGHPNSLYAGILHGGTVIRKRGHRHYVSKDEFSLDYYPPFCKGAMYVLSTSLLPKMLDLSRQVTRIGPDDAYVGLLADQLGISAVRIEGFFQRRPNFLWLISECELRDLLAIGDFLTPSQLNYIHEVKHAKTSGQGFDASHSLCVSLYMKLSLLRLFCVICLPSLFFFGYRRSKTRIS